MRQSAPASTPEALVCPDAAELMALAGAGRGLPDWQATRPARQQGSYRALVRGRGMEYAESRPYQAGDDVRALDWRLTARLGRPHTKLFREERERPVFLVVDLGPGMAFASRGAFKRVQAARVAALLAWKAAAVGDRVGGIVHAADEHHELVPGQGALAVARLLQMIVKLGARSPAELASRGEPPSQRPVLRRLRRLAKPGSLLLVVGDGRGLEDQALSELRELRRHCDLGLVLIHDPLEISLPPLTHPLRLQQGSSEYLLPPPSAQARAAYAENFARRQAVLARFAREQHCPLATLLTTDNALDGVRALLQAPL